jgi:hypothetical protein
MPQLAQVGRFLLQVVSRLQVHPELGTGFEEDREPQGGVRLLPWRKISGEMINRRRLDLQIEIR